jgi:hypothetical protein
MRSRRRYQEDQVPLSYNRPGIQLGEGDADDPAMVRDLQHDLRALGYLRQGIDGIFGAGTTRAIRALQYDLLNNRGNSTDSDGSAPVAMVSFNDNGEVRRVTAITGVLDEALVQCLEIILGDGRVPPTERHRSARREPGGAGRDRRNREHRGADTLYRRNGRAGK